MVLVQHKVLHALLWSIRLSSIFKCFPFYWDKKQNRLRLYELSKRTHLKWRLKGAFLYLCLAVFQIVWFWSNDSMIVKMHGVMNTAGYTMGLASIYVVCQRAEELVGLINNMIQFEERNYTNLKLNEPTRKTWLTKALIKTHTFTSYLVFTYHLGVLVQPCYPMCVGFWTMAQCNGSMDTGILEKVKLVLVTMWSFSSFSFIMPGLILQTQLMLLQGYSFSSYLENFTSQMSTWSGKVENSPWKQFRDIQLLLVKHRVLNTQYLLSTIMIADLICEIASLFKSIDILRGKDGNSIDLGMMFVFFWCAVCSAINIIYFFGALADVNQASEETRANVKKIELLQKNKWFKRFFASCPVQKIYLNYTSYVEVLTPLNIQAFVVDQVISLLYL